MDELVDQYVHLERYGMLIKILWKDKPDSTTRRKIKELLLSQSKGYILIYFTLSDSNQILSTVCPLYSDINFASFKMGIIEYFDCFNGCLCIWQNDRNVNIQCESITLKLMFFPYHHKILTQGKVNDQKMFIHAYCRTINKIKPNTYELNDFKGSFIDQMLHTSVPSNKYLDHSISLDSLKSSDIEYQCSSTPNLDLSSSLDYEPSWELIEGIKEGDGSSSSCSRQDLISLRDSVNNNLCCLKDQMSFLTETLFSLPGLSEKVDRINGLKNTVKKYQSIEEQGGLSFKEQEDIVGENVKLRKENVELRLSLQKRQHKLDDLFKDTVQQKIQYEEQNGHVQGIVESLQTDLKDKNIALTKTNVTNQEILSDSLRCQSELKMYKERYTDDFQRLLCSLGREIGLCVDDVKSFLNLCISRIKGDEPSLDSLLGLRDSADRLDHTLPTLDMEYIKSQLKEMSELRKDVDELRHLVSEHYAQEIGDNMCITQ